jgi:uncharacterized protein YndB with AHSA1/START domain
MSRNTLVVAATPEQCWRVLADGWLFPLWVVGATRMRDVDAHWPAVGAQLHHSVGVWPLVIDDTTEVLASTPPTSLRLRARAWPTGAAHVELRLEPVDDGTRVAMEEDAVAGPARMIPPPLRHAQLSWRNRESLRRLAFVIEGRQGAATHGA